MYLDLHTDPRIAMIQYELWHEDFMHLHQVRPTEKAEILSI